MGAGRNRCHLDENTTWDNEPHPIVLGVASQSSSAGRGKPTEGRQALDRGIRKCNPFGVSHTVLGHFVCQPKGLSRNGSSQKNAPAIEPLVHARIPPPTFGTPSTAPATQHECFQPRDRFRRGPGGEMLSPGVDGWKNGQAEGLGRAEGGRSLKLVAKVATTLWQCIKSTGKAFLHQEWPAHGLRHASTARPRGGGGGGGQLPAKCARPKSPLSGVMPRRCCPAYAGWHEADMEVEGRNPYTMRQQRRSRRHKRTRNHRATHVATPPVSDRVDKERAGEAGALARKICSRSRSSRPRGAGPTSGSASLIWRTEATPNERSPDPLGIWPRIEQATVAPELMVKRYLATSSSSSSSGFVSNCRALRCVGVPDVGLPRRMNEHFELLLGRRSTT